MLTQFLISSASGSELLSELLSVTKSRSPLDFVTERGATKWDTTSSLKEVKLCFSVVSLPVCSTGLGLRPLQGRPRSDEIGQTELTLSVVSLPDEVVFHLVPVIKLI